MSNAYDTIVLGLGGIGSSAALHLARRGRRVLGLEQFGVAHDRGASHGGSRMIRQAYFEHPAYVPLVLRSYELWAELEALAGRPLLTVTGGLTIGPPDSHTVQGVERSARRWDLPHERWNRAEAAARAPAFALPEGAVAVFERRAGFVRPEATVQSQVALATGHGADLRFGCPPARWSVAPSGDGVRVTAGAERFSADRLVLTPGPWAPSTIGAPAGALRVERRVQYWFEPRTVAARAAAAGLPVYLSEYRPGALLYGFPSGDDPATLKIGLHHRGAACTADTVDRTVHPAEVAHARDRLERCLPGAGGVLARAAACLYTLTEDGHFAVGRHPHHPQVVLGCGFSGHGFKFAPAIGEALADLAEGRDRSSDLALFDPARLWRTARADGAATAAAVDGQEEE